jgi:hypothetical protein
MSCGACLLAPCDTRFEVKGENHLCLHLSFFLWFSCLQNPLFHSTQIHRLYALNFAIVSYGSYATALV